MNKDKLKIFYLTSRFPYPIDKGDKLRTYHQLKYLTLKNEVFLYSLYETFRETCDESGIKKLGIKYKIYKLKFFDVIKNILVGLFKRLPIQSSYYYSRKIKKDIDEELKKFKPDIIICQMIRTSEYVKDINTSYKVLDYIDVLSYGLYRRFKEANFINKFPLWLEYSRVSRYEADIYNYFDKSIIITEQDKEHLQLQDKSKVEVVLNGVDFDYYFPNKTSKEFDLFFNGNLSYPPNIDAIEFLVKEILPILKTKIPQIRVLISGASLSKKIKKLENDNVIIKGWIDDIRLYYWKSRIFVAPLRFGTGIQNKVLQALAMKIPCVVSPITAKGICKNPTDFLLVAENTQEYVKKILLLLNDEKFYNKIAEEGYKFVIENYDWKLINSKLEKILLDINKKSEV